MNSFNILQRRFKELELETATDIKRNIKLGFPLKGSRCHARSPENGKSYYKRAIKLLERIGQL